MAFTLMEGLFIVVALSVVVFLTAEYEGSNLQKLNAGKVLLICLIFIRGKQPTPEMLQMAEDDGRVVMTTRFGMFSACGKLYEAGAGAGCM